MIKRRVISNLEVKGELLARVKSNTPLILSRIDICSSCAYLCHLDYNCIKCDCDFINKIQIEDKHCPFNKW